jgi:hypothetical protein
MGLYRSHPCLNGQQVSLTGREAVVEVWPRARNEHAADMHILDWVRAWTEPGRGSLVVGIEVHPVMVCEAMISRLDFRRRRSFFSKSCRCI